MLQAAIDAKTRTLRGTENLAADPILDPPPVVLFCSNSHGLCRRPGLARLLLELLAHVAHTLLLVGIWLPEGADASCDLAHVLLVGAGDGDASLLLDIDGDAGRDGKFDGVRVTQTEHDFLAFHLRPIPDSHDVQLFRESLRDSMNPIRQPGHQLALRPFHLHVTLMEVYLDPVGNGNGLTTDARHDLSPHVAEDFASHSLSNCLRPSHDSSSRRDNADPQPIANLRDIVLTAVDATARFRHAAQTS